MFVVFLRAAAGNRNSRKKLFYVVLCRFSRISEGTLGTFLAWFWN